MRLCDLKNNPRHLQGIVVALNTEKLYLREWSYKNSNYK